MIGLLLPPGRKDDQCSARSPVRKGTKLITGIDARAIGTSNASCTWPSATSETLLPHMPEQVPANLYRHGERIHSVAVRVVNNSPWSEGRKSAGVPFPSRLVRHTISNVEGSERWFGANVV